MHFRDGPSNIYCTHIYFPLIHHFAILVYPLAIVGSRNMITDNRKVTMKI